MPLQLRFYCWVFAEQPVIIWFSPNRIYDPFHYLIRLRTHFNSACEPSFTSISFNSHSQSKNIPVGYLSGTVSPRCRNCINIYRCFIESCRESAAEREIWIRKAMSSGRAAKMASLQKFHEKFGIIKHCALNRYRFCLSTKLRPLIPEGSATITGGRPERQH